MADNQDQFPFTHREGEVFDDGARRIRVDERDLFEIDHRSTAGVAIKAKQIANSKVADSDRLGIRNAKQVIANSEISSPALQAIGRYLVGELPTP